MLRSGPIYVHDEGCRRTSGLMFITFVRSIAGQLTPVVQRLDQSDALNEWTMPIGSSILAFPGGYPADGWLAQGSSRASPRQCTALPPCTGVNTPVQWKFGAGIMGAMPRCAP
ncbi:MAG: hypothetical protein ACOH16_08105 [Propionibacteriaceae bacterium]